MSLNTKGENLAQLNIVMKDRTDEAAEAVLAENLRRRYVDIPDLQKTLAISTLAAWLMTG